MGKMKEIWAEMLQNEYRGDYDAYIQDLARQTCEEFIPVENHLCPNCMSNSIVRNETEIQCESCAQEFILVEKNILRFK